MFKDWDKLDLALNEFQLGNRVFVNDLLFQLANTLVALIQRFAPFRTGAYARSWVIGGQSGNTIKVFSLADPRLFVMLEFTGSPPHEIRTRNRDALAFIGRDGTLRFASVVLHPGFKARPHLRPAMLELKRMSKGIVYNTVSRHFTLLKKEGQRAATANGYRRVSTKGQGSAKGFGRSNVGRTSTDVTANIGRGTKGKISAQLTSRMSFRKRIKVRGLRRVGTSEGKKAGFR